MKNLFDNSAFGECTGEQAEILAEKGSLENGGAVRVERIHSFGEVSPEGFWYDQQWDEWVAVIRGEAVLEYGGGHKETMAAGDHVVIEAGVKHRVAAASYDCVWLAVHYNQ